MTNCARNKKPTQPTYNPIDTEAPLTKMEPTLITLTKKSPQKLTRKGKNARKVTKQLQQLLFREHAWRLQLFSSHSIRPIEVGRHDSLTLPLPPKLPQNPVSWALKPIRSSLSRLQPGQTVKKNWYNHERTNSTQNLHVSDWMRNHSTETGTC